MTTSSDSTDRIRLDLIDALRSAVAAHTAGRVLDIDDGMENLEVRIANLEGPDRERLSLVLEFWAGWSDSANHGWLFYPGMNEDTWCPMAKGILEDLGHDRQLSNPQVVEMFGWRPPTPGIFQRVSNWWRKTAAG
jgi:hypothetical protein